MRLRHVKGSEEKLNNSNYIIKEPTKYKGKYSELFNNTNKIQIEIAFVTIKFPFPQPISI